MIRQYALKEIRRRKLRSAANIVGYSIAIAFLVVAVTLAGAYNWVAEGTLNGIGTHFAVYIPVSQTCPCQFGEVGPVFKNTYTPTYNTTIVETIRGLPGVADAAPCLMFRLENLTICGINATAQATRTNVVAPNEVVEGRYLTENDSDSVMVDSIYAQIADIKVEDHLSAFNHDFTVIGIVNPALHSRPAGTANIYAPLPTVQDIARHYGQLYNFAVRDINVVLVEIAATGDAQYIATVQNSALDALQSFAGQTGALVGYQCGFIARGVVAINEQSAWAISIILIVCITLFSLRSQFGSVVERTKEIGVLKAIGWKDSDVTKQVFVESLLQGTVGGAIGIVAGLVIILLIPLLGLLPLTNLVLAISPWVLLLGFAASICAGVVAGVFPAWRAAKLQPAEALRRF